MQMDGRYGGGGGGGGDSCMQMDGRYDGGGGGGDSCMQMDDRCGGGGGGCYEFESGGMVRTRDPKPRLRWTVDLHDKFVDVVTKLGGPDSWFLYFFL
ncbi:hypothetical protein L6452_20418 [Arctium lappa]|uniref:Uncharacterized protein n=1 Tax=Arctium lappa TaxID=4217 RepID=A0ACB9BBR7_ARCLA|nr:hypothetical protein L6452_20418 [Arctium lappa]